MWTCNRGPVTTIRAGVNGLEPPNNQFARCFFYLDGRCDPPSQLDLTRNLPQFVQEALHGLMPQEDFVTAGRASGRGKAYAITRNGERRGRWADLVDEHVEQLGASWATMSTEAKVVEVRLSASRFSKRHEYLLLEVQLVYAAEIVDEPLLVIARQIGQLTDLAYAETSVNRARNPPYTTLDLALRRNWDASAGACRQQLRGYEWATVCNNELLAKLGGVDSLFASGSFAAVTPLDAGGVLLQATPHIIDYGPEQAHHVFEVVRSVLPPGQPRPTPAADLDLLIMRDAAP